MASHVPISQSQTKVILTKKIICHQIPRTHLSASLVLRGGSFRALGVSYNYKTPEKFAKCIVVSRMNTENDKEKNRAEEMITKGFVGEMRSTALRLHTKEQAPRDGRNEVEQPEQRHVSKWDPTVEGYLKFLVDSKLIYDTLEAIIEKAAFPIYFELQDTGMERSGKLGKDLEWFKEQGYILPQPSEPGLSHAQYLKEQSEMNPQAIVCHFYNLYFGHTAGGRIMGKKVSEKILKNKELEFYTWDKDVWELLQNATNKLNNATESWTREEKNRCLEETETAFKYYGKVIRQIMS